MSDVTITDKHGVPLRRAAPPGRARVSAAAYDAADTLSQELAGWHPALASADRDWLWERPEAVARGRDLTRNNGFANGARRSEVDAAIGANLRLSYKPDYQALGLTKSWADGFAREIEARWRVFADDPDYFCDAARHDTMSSLFALAYGHYWADGDAIGVLLWKERGGPYNTTLQIIDPDRLSNPNDLADEDRLRGGVHLDELGAAVAYEFRRRHPQDVATFRGGDEFTWDRVDRDLPWGRPQVVHFFERQRAGQTRGVSRMAAIVEPLAMQHKMDRVTLQAAIIEAILGFFITSPFDPEMVADGLVAKDTLPEYQQLRSAFHDQNRVRLGGVQANILVPGEEPKILAPQHPNSQYPEFTATVLRRIASGLGLSYEQLSQDWSKVNYSSARAALLEVWRGLTARRQRFTQRFCTPIFGAWLEEVLIDKREFDMPAAAPDFYDAKAAWCRARWIGPGRGWVDPVKEVQAAAGRMDAGISTLEHEAAEQGLDWQEVAEQQALEDGTRAELGLPPRAALTVGSAPDVAEDEGRGNEQ